MPLPRSALLVVDVQEDFCPGGSLAVPNGDEVVEIINTLTKSVSFPGGVFYSKDWHPRDHISFASNHTDKKPFEQIILENGTKQTLWPDHCVQNSPGSNFARGLNVPNDAVVILKGENQMYDSYSAFFDNMKMHKTTLSEKLKSAGVETVYICGLALDVCVLYTALDAIALGFNAVLLNDACRGLSTVSNEGAIKNMMEAGVIVSDTNDLLKNSH